MSTIVEPTSDMVRDETPGLAPLARLMEDQSVGVFEFEASQVIQSLLFDHRYAGHGACDCLASWPCSAYEHAEHLLVTWVRERAGVC